ncbi:MAG TPA: type II toxin-antitoxin system RelE/ParE family toxin [Candidatus Sulfotelmatobacter sp.]|nr:type II toxin-antitoxin system RelE/ParE family toxin [Candidatus Sulfotelmatobacter sp.]
MASLSLSAAKAYRKSRWIDTWRGEKEVDIGRYLLSPEAAGDLMDIWKYMGVEVVPRLPTESLLRFAELEFLCGSPSMGHRRKDLSVHHLRSFAAYSCLIVYRRTTKPLQIVSILHGRRDVERILDERPSSASFVALLEISL